MHTRNQATPLGADEYDGRFNVNEYLICRGKVVALGENTNQDHSWRFYIMQRRNFDFVSSSDIKVPSASSNVSRKSYIQSIAKHASQQLGFFFTAYGFLIFSPTNHTKLPYLSFSSILLPCLNCVPKSTLCLFDKVQSKVFCLVNNLNLTKSRQRLSHRPLVADISS